MNRLILTLLLCSFFFSSGFSQTNGNIPLLCKTDFGRYWGAADVWGVQIGGVNYALVIIDGGLSIVNTDNPLNPVETAHINRTNYNPNLWNSPRLGVPDVETFTYGGIIYAYLATDDPSTTNDNPLVIIINVNEAISQQGLILFDPVNGTPDPNEVYAGKIDDLPNVTRSHTLTIEDSYLYVASYNQYIPIWYLGNNPTSPLYITSLFNNTPNAQLHEIHAVSTITNRVNLYLSFLRGGLRTYYIIYIPGERGSISASVSSSTIHIYDADRAFPDFFDSGDPLFDYRLTHSAWTTNDQAYVFTTDELTAWPPDHPYKYSQYDANLYSSGVLQTPRRIGSFLRTWKRINLGQSSSYKGGYYVAEESPWGITDLTQIDTTMVPNSIHQMFARWSYLYVAHYTQGFRMLDISDPENIIELGWYDDTPSISFNPNSSQFFRKRTEPNSVLQKFYLGIFGVFPDPNRSNICYAGGYDGFYIFDVAPPPYPPANLTVTSSLSDHPYLQWGFTGDENNIDHYNIYKKSTSAGFQFIAETVNKYYEDTNESICNPPPGVQCESGHWVYYYVTAVTVSGYESNASNREGIVVNGGMPEKISVDPPIIEQPIDYSLSQNYPNPFNPSTTIYYSIKSPDLVQLKVFDILGKEIRSLVNEHKEAGSYEIDFDASDFPSGIYFYTIQSGNFSSSKKMILLK